MLAWILDESPGGYRHGEIADPPVGPDDVRVAPVASALNHMDLWVTRGRPRPTLPHVPGCDVAGIVESVGSAVMGISVGDEVVINPAVSPLEMVIAHGDDAPMYPGFEILGEQRWGGHGELVTVPARNIVPKSDGVSWEACAAFPLATLTAAGPGGIKGVEGCGVVSGDAAGRLLAAAVANPTPRWYVGGAIRTIVVVALLPGEPACGPNGG